MIQPKLDHSSPGNPFRPGMGLDPPYLADRAQQLARFDQYLAGFPDFPRNVRLTGLRGVGKTVLLRHYEQLAEHRGWAVVRRECSEHLLDESVFALAVVEDCRKAVDRLSRGAALRSGALSVARRALDLLGSITVSLEGVTLAVKPSGPFHREPALMEDRLLAAIELACETVRVARRSGLLLSYDEAHLLGDTPRWRQYALGLFLAGVARAQREGLPVMLVVSGLPTLTDRLARARSYSERMFQAEHLEALTPPEDVLAFTRPIESRGRVAEPEAISAVRRDTGGYAYMVQFFGALLWDAVPQDRPITFEDYQDHREAIVWALDRSFFDARLARAAPVEQRLLMGMARHGEVVSLRALGASSGLPNRRLQPMIRRLEDKGLVYRPKRGQLAFTVPLFGEYLRRRHGQ